MREATADHNGRPLAILIDGTVVAAPVVRGPISTSAVITGRYSDAEAERIVEGIRIR
jgi:preprotein translocase subunit SecD